MKRTGRILSRGCSVLLALLLHVSPVLTMPAQAASQEQLDAAWRLYSLELLQGRGLDENGQPDFDLDTPGTRQEAVVFLIRMMGRENWALSIAAERCPFTDVSGWARPYLAFASIEGHVQGRSDTWFDAQSPIQPTEFLTMVLRAMGYSSGQDFQWDAAWEFSDAIGLTDGRYSAQTAEFLRGDMAWICSRALDVPGKEGSPYATLFDSMNEQGFFGQVEVLETAEPVTYIADDTENMPIPRCGRPSADTTTRTSCMYIWTTSGCFWRPLQGN